MTRDKDQDLIERTAKIVSAHVRNNGVATDEVLNLVIDLHGTVQALTSDTADVDRPTPAVPIAQSVSADHLVCLEDGLKFKSLKRHLRAAHGLSPEEYRARWGLQIDYPMSSQNSSKRRAEVAKEFGLRRDSGKARHKGKR